MKILPTSPISIPTPEAKPLSKPNESTEMEKENFSLGHEDKKLKTTETRKELKTEGPNAQSIKPDFPYSLVAAVNFPLQTPVAPIGTTTDEQIEVENAPENAIALDSATAFPKPIRLGAPDGISIQLGRPIGKGSVGIPSDSDLSISAKWQKIGPNLDFTTLSPEFAAQNEKLTDAIKNFEIPGFAKEIDLTKFCGGKNPVQLKPETTILPNAFPQSVTTPLSNSGIEANSLSELQPVHVAPAELKLDGTMLYPGLVAFPLGAENMASELNGPKKLDPVPVPVEEIPSLSGTAGQPKKLDPNPVPVEQVPQQNGTKGHTKKLDPTPVPVESNPQLNGTKTQPKKLSPVPAPVEQAPPIAGSDKEIKKLNPTPAPVVETKPGEKKIEDQKGSDWIKVAPKEMANYPTDEIISASGDANDDWSLDSDSIVSGLGVTSADPHANLAVSSFTKQTGDVREIKLNVTGGIKPENRLTDVASKRLVEVVADRLEAIAAAKPRNGVTIQLRPLDLGSITMIVKNSGTDVGAELYASHESVRQALDHNRSLLSQHLEAKGMHLTNVTVASSSLSNSSSTFAEQNAQRTLQQNTSQTSTLRYAEKDSAIDPHQLLRKGKTDGVDYWI